MERIVKVEWYDAVASTSHWQQDINIARCVSVGYLVKRDRKQILIATTRSDDGEYGGRFAIPSGFIKNIEHLSPVVKEAKPQ